MKKIIVTLSVLLSLAFVNNVDAQKIGHVDSQAVFQAMPATKTLERELMAKGKKYEDQLKVLYTELQAIAQDVQANGKTYTDLVLEDKYRKGAELEEKIAKIESGAQQELAQYEDNKLIPIQNSIIAAIQKVAGANGFSYVFDSSAGLLLVKPATDDLTNLVKSELGIY